MAENSKKKCACCLSSPVSVAVGFCSRYCIAPVALAVSDSASIRGPPLASSALIMIMFILSLLDLRPKEERGYVGRGDGENRFQG